MLRYKNKLPNNQTHEEISLVRPNGDKAHEAICNLSDKVWRVNPQYDGGEKISTQIDQEPSEKTE